MNFVKVKKKKEEKTKEREREGSLSYIRYVLIFRNFNVNYLHKVNLNWRFIDGSFATFYRAN